MPRVLTAVAVAALLAVDAAGAVQGPPPNAPAAPASASAPWPRLTLNPPNVERTDPALARLRVLLLDAIRERRLDAVKALMAPTIRDQDVDLPVDDVLASFGTLAPGAPLGDEWQALDQALRLGGVRRGNVYVLPYIERSAAQWKGRDERLFIAGRDVAIRANADPSSRWSRGCLSGSCWRRRPSRTARRAGRRLSGLDPLFDAEHMLAWVCTTDVRPVSGLYYTFTRFAGGWKLTRHLLAAPIEPTRPLGLVERRRRPHRTPSYTCVRCVAFLRSIPIPPVRAIDGGRIVRAPRPMDLTGSTSTQGATVTLRILMFSAIVSPARRAPSPAPSRPRAAAHARDRSERRRRVGRDRPAGDHRSGGAAIAGTSEILHTMVHLAVYDAVVAIEGGSRPFAAKITATRGADVSAAVATAAYLTARPRIAAANLVAFDQAYTSYLAALPGGDSIVEGVRVGQQASAALLALRANDGFANVVLYECSMVPPPIGEFTPDSGCPTGPTSAQPVDAKVGGITPFTLKRADVFRPDGPDPLESRRYARDFAETRDYGRVDSTVRSAEQTDVAWFWAENPYIHWNRNMMALAQSHGLSVRKTARLFAMVNTAVSDAIIAGFEAKYHYRAWRPRTAIPQADIDGNPDTDADPTWRPLISVNHPDTRRATASGRRRSSAASPRSSARRASTGR